MKLNKRGFSSVETLLLLILLILIGFIGWYVWHQKAAPAKTSNSSSSQVTTTTKAKDPYEGWKSYTLKYEKFSFKYPASYTLTDTSSSTDQPEVVPGTDHVTLSKANGFKISISTGLYGIGGACPECSIAEAKAVTFLNQNIYLNFVDTGSNMIGSVVAVTNQTDYIGAIPGKNVKLQSTDTILPMSVNTHYEANGVVVEKPLATIKASEEIAEVVKILESASY